MSPPDPGHKAPVWLSALTMCRTRGPVDAQPNQPKRNNGMMSMNWLDDTPVFAGQKLVVVGGSSGMGRQAAADVVAAGGSAVIIGEDAGKVDDTVQTLAKEGSAARAPSATWPTPSRSCFPRRPAGSPAPSGTSTAASWPDATSPPPARPCTGPAHGRA